MSDISGVSAASLNRALNQAGAQRTSSPFGGGEAESATTVTQLRDEREERTREARLTTGTDNEASLSLAEQDPPVPRGGAATVAREIAEEGVNNANPNRTGRGQVLDITV